LKRADANIAAILFASALALRASPLDLYPVWTDEAATLALLEQNFSAFWKTITQIDINFAHADRIGDRSRGVSPL
jgi:hypothetical protein